MTTVRVVPAFDELEDRHLRVGLRLETVAVDQLTFERREEALRHGVIVAIADLSHRRSHTHQPAAFAKGERGVLTGLKESSQHGFVEPIVSDSVKPPQEFSNQGPFSVAHSTSQQRHRVLLPKSD